jgi:hypothetical protein
MARTVVQDSYFSVRVSAAQLERLDQLVAQRGTTRSETFRALIDASGARLPPPPLSRRQQFAAEIARLNKIALEET